MKTAVQLLLPEMDGITGFYEARTDRVLCVRCAGTPTPAGTPTRRASRGDDVRRWLAGSFSDPTPEDGGRRLQRLIEEVTT